MKMALGSDCILYVRAMKKQDDDQTFMILFGMQREYQMLIRPVIMKTEKVEEIGRKMKRRVNTSSGTIDKIRYKSDGTMR